MRLLILVIALVVGATEHVWSQQVSNVRAFLVDDRFLLITIF